MNRPTWRDELDHWIENAAGFRQASQDAAHYLHQKLLAAGDGARELADLGHGKPLGHPLHPALTDITVGGWTLVTCFDLLGLLPGFKSARQTADHVLGLSTLGAVPTILAGLLDYSAIKRDAASYGAAHGLLNGAAFFWYARSLLSRLGGHRAAALLSSLLGFGFVVAASWLGGDLVYRHRVGVDHTPDATVEEWTAVVPLAELPEDEPFEVRVDEVPLLLLRRGDEVYAINGVCSHAGGPLPNGRLMTAEGCDTCIECPWHQSVFDVRDGHVVHGPATFPQPRYDVRVQGGQVELRSVMKAV